MTLSLPNTLAAWDTDAFADVLIDELSGIDPSLLKLPELMQYGNAVVGRPRFMVLGSSREGGFIRLRLGVFFQSLEAGCSCADDPTPLDPCNEYGELELRIHHRSALAEARVL